MPVVLVELPCNNKFNNSDIVFRHAASINGGNVE